jgi:hypothetical protein
MDGLIDLLNDLWPIASIAIGFVLGLAVIYFLVNFITVNVDDVTGELISNKLIATHTVRHIVPAPTREERHPSNCSQCGAPMNSIKCDYCGTRNEVPDEPSKSRRA